MSRTDDQGAGARDAGPVKDLAIIYTRVSTSQQEQNYSLPTQLAACQQYAQQHGLRVIDELTDSLSAATLDRPGLERARVRLRAGEATALIVYCSDRLSRDVADMLLLRDEFRTHGITLHFVNRGAQGDTAEDEMLAMMESVMGAYERRKIAERSMRGRKGKVASGKVPGNGPPPYGYRYVGHQRDRELVIDEEQAAIVRMIFAWYVEGDDESGPMSATQVARKLEALRVPTRADLKPHPKKQRGFAQWNPEYIRALLHNEVYCGTFQAYRLRRKEDKRCIRRPKADWVGVPVPAIVSRALWEAAQARLARAKALSPRNAVAARYLLRCRIACHCGYTWQGEYRAYKDLRYYACGGRRKRTTRLHPCDMPYIEAPWMEEPVWNWIVTQVLDPDALAQGLAEYQAQEASVVEEVRAQIATLKQQCEQLEVQLERLVNLYLTDGIDRAMYDQRRAELTAARDELTPAIEALSARTASLTPDDIISLQLFASMVAEELSGLDVMERRRVIDLLDVHVRMVREDGQPIAYVTCRLRMQATPIGIDTSVRWS